MSPPLEDNLLKLITRTWKLYKALAKGPAQLQVQCTALLSMIACLQEIHEIVIGHQLSNDDEATLLNLNAQCTAALISDEGALAKFKFGQMSLSGLADVHIQIEDQTNELSLVLESLRERYSRLRLVEIIEQFIVSGPEDRLREIASDWSALTVELCQLGLSLESVEEEFFFIDSFLEEKFLGFHDEEEEEELPDYTPGAQKGSLAEKVQALEQTTRLVTLDEAIADPPPTSSKASPPAYTFDSGTDQEIDEEFLKHIRRAVENEASRRSLKQAPSLIAQPYSWLPQPLQTRFYGEDYIAPLSSDCFTIMAYETAPQCTEEIGRFTDLLRVSFQHKIQSATEKVVQEAPTSLDVLSIATSKFILLHDQKAAQGNFSDLDSFYYEHSTAIVHDDKQTPFPTEEFDLARKSYYNLLTYIMGMLHLFSDIFQGRIYLTRSLAELELLWTKKKMATRTAWIEKQLTAWDKVENAILHCRSMRALQAGLRDQAIKCLDDWKEAETILSGRSGDETITLTVISVSGVPKPTIGHSSTYVRVVNYGTNRWNHKLMEEKTSVCSRTQSPVWNKTFFLRTLMNAKYVDLELYDKIAGMDKYLGRIRLEFAFVPGVEATFAERSLMHGLDEEVEFPVVLSAVAKGKGKVPIMFRVGLKWKGRFERVEELGLPIRPPGKMFRSDIVGIPL